MNAKKLMTVLLALALVFSMTACSFPGACMNPGKTADSGKNAMQSDMMDKSMDGKTDMTDSKCMCGDGSKCMSDGMCKDGCMCMKDGMCTDKCMCAKKDIVEEKAEEGSEMKEAAAAIGPSCGAPEAGSSCGAPDIDVALSFGCCG